MELLLHWHSESHILYRQGVEFRRAGDPLRILSLVGGKATDQHGKHMCQCRSTTAQQAPHLVIHVAG
eukprot:1159078-Pelagomonas_calceolata.AAC.2